MRTRLDDAAGLMEWKNIEDVLNLTFVSHRLSPLYRFQTSTAALRTYAAQLVQTITFNGQVEGHENSAASISQLEMDGEGCGITITVMLPGIVEQAPLVGLLYGDGADKHSDEFSAFPLLLTKGPLDQWKPVLDWLQSAFDCYVAPLRVPPYRLAMLAAEWVAIGGSRPLEFTYLLTSQDAGIKTISMTFAAEAILQLQNSISSSGFEQQNPSENALLTALEQHFQSHFHFALSEAQLVKIGCAVAMLGADGKFKLHSQHASLKVLNDLVAISVV